MPVLGDWPLMLHDEVVQLDGDYHSFIYRISPAGKAAMLSQHQSRLLSSCRRNVHDMSVWYGSFEFWCTGEWQLDIWTLFFLQECLSQHSCSQSGIILWAGRREDWGRNFFSLGTPWELLMVMGCWTEFNCKCKAPQVVRDNRLQRIHLSCFHHAQFHFVSFFWADCFWQLWSVVWDCDIVPFWISCDLHRVRLWQTWALDTTFKQRSFFIHPPWRSAMNKWTLLMEGHREIKLSVYFCHVFFPNYTVYQCATEDILGMAKF